MEIKKRYVVRFKRKNLRPNQRDDKITILKNAINMDPKRITRRDERVLAVHEVGDNTTALAENPEKIVDINEYTVPLTMVNLSPDQVQSLKKDKNIEVVYEDEPANIRILETEIMPLAPDADARSREFVTENIKRMKAPQAWTHKTGYAVKVAVMDTGIDKTHPDLAKNFKGGAAFISGDSAAPGTINDGYSGGFHGSGCAGIVGAIHGNSQGVVGMAPDCFLYDLRVFPMSSGGRTISVGETAAAYTWCGNNNMDVCSMSFGAGPLPRYDETSSWPQWMTDNQAAINASYTKGVIFVAASGNEADGGRRSNKYADRTYPAAFNFVASVGAIQDHLIAAFSNTGDTIDFVAPGTNNQGNTDFGPYGLTTYAGRNGNRVYRNEYGYFAGTSMACPHVAGCMALGYSAYKPEKCVVAYNGLGTKFTRQQIIARTVAFTADGLGTPPMNSNNLHTGFGLPNAEAAVRILLNVNDEGNQVGHWPASLEPKISDDGLATINGLFD